MNYNINAKVLGYRELNKRVKDIIEKSPHNANININDVCGQKYIGDGIKACSLIKIYGVPGNDLGAFMDGPQIEVYENAQDGTGNTMNSGKIIVYGDAGDILGYSMRGGEIYVKGSVGYRAGIHMKAYKKKIPVIIIGGRAGDFLGEYMSGGVIIVLGQNADRQRELSFDSTKEVVGNLVGTGMHGGTIYIKGKVSDYRLGKEVKKMPLDKMDLELLQDYVKNHQNFFGCGQLPDLENFTKLIPFSHRPYGKLYAY